MSTRYRGSFEFVRSGNDKTGKAPGMCGSAIGIGFWGWWTTDYAAVDELDAGGGGLEELCDLEGGAGGDSV